MNLSEPSILPHHEPAARMWGQGGRAYDDVSFAISDALAHAAQRLHAEAHQEILDVATGTGWSARNVARRGARVTAVDISPELLAAAAELSAHVRPAISFQLADAERLPTVHRGLGPGWLGRRLLLGHRAPRRCGAPRGLAARLG